MALFYELPSDLFSFPSFYNPPTRRSVYRRPALPTVSPFSLPFEIVAEKPRPQHVIIKKRHSGELKLQEDSENGWFAQVELPGVNSIKNVDLELHNRTLFVRSKAKSDFQTVLSNYTLQVPEGVDEKRIKGVLSNGVLKISLPKLKPVEEKPKESVSNNALANKLEPTNNIFSIWQRCLQGPKETSEDNETHRITRLEFPEGFNKEDLDIEFNKGVLTISAQKKDDVSTFSFKRCVALPKNLTESDITAKFEGNTLEIRYPKAIPEQEKPSFKIQIAANQTSEPSEAASSPSTTEEEHQEAIVEAQTESKKEGTESVEAENEEESLEHKDDAADFEIVSEDENVAA